MLKKQTKRRKSKSIVKEIVTSNSNFKDGSINISTKNKIFQSLKKVNDVCIIPKKNEQSIIVTQRAVNSFDFILAMIAKHHEIDELIISFYRIGKKVINEIDSLFEKKLIPKVHLLINDGFPKLVPDCYNRIKELEGKSMQLFIENTHTKIILMKCKDNFYVIQGSGNLSINARIEQYIFFNDKNVYDFHKNWITNIK